MSSGRLSAMPVSPDHGAAPKQYASLLYRLARIMLLQGLTAHDFARMADRAFVRAARDLLEEQGKEPSYSRISAVTGLHRHAVSSLAGPSEGPSTPDDGPKEYQRHRLARVLSGWYEDPQYTDREGRPRPLTLDGPSPTFADLVRDYSGDIYPSIILDELERVGAVVRDRQGRVVARSRRYIAGGASAESVRHVEAVATDVLRTLEHNLSSAEQERLFEDSSVSTELPARVVPLLRRLLERRATAFLDDLDGWLAARERDAADSGSGEPTVRAGVRVVMVVEPDPDDARDRRQLDSRKR